MTSPPTVALVTLGCARNDVDSEELAARLEAGGFRLVDDPDEAESVVVNTCGFVEAAKKDSVDTLLAAAQPRTSGRSQTVVAVGCLAERYGRELADSLPEADAVLGFDDYPVIADRLRSIVAGERHESHVPRDRRTLLPLAPVARADADSPSIPGHAQSAPDLPAGIAPASGPRAMRRRLDGRPDGAAEAGVGLRPALLVLRDPQLPRLLRVAADQPRSCDEAGWLAATGVRELFLVSENSTSYGKDLGDLRLLETLLPRARRGRRRTTGAGLLPAAGRDAARSGRDDRVDAGGGRLLRPVVPARGAAGAPADAAVRGRRTLPDVARRGASGRARRGCAQQLHRRLPR